MKKFLAALMLIAALAFVVTGCDNASGSGNGNGDGNGDDNGIAPTITTTSLPAGTVGTAYSHTLAATGDTPITWSVESGALPTGLGLAEGSGVISGTPETAQTYTFTIKAANASGNISKVFSINISNGENPTPTGELKISIVRANSSPSEFKFGLDQVTNATAYKAFKEGSEVASSASTTVSVPGTELSSREFTELMAKVFNGGTDMGLDGQLPAMVKYPAATVTLDGYTDLFKFLAATIHNLYSVDYDAHTPHLKLEEAIRGSLPNMNSEEYALGCKDYFAETYDIPAAMKTVMSHYPQIMEYLANSGTELATEHTATINETLPRIWFNKVVDDAEADAALNNLMGDAIKAKYPKVKSVQ